LAEEILIIWEHDPAHRHHRQVFRTQEHGGAPRCCGAPEPSYPYIVGSAIFSQNVAKDFAARAPSRPNSRGRFVEHGSLVASGDVETLMDNEGLRRRHLGLAETA